MSDVSMDSSDRSMPFSERELHLSDADFDRISAKVYKTTGIVLPEHKRQMIYSRLSKRIREKNFASFKDYLNFIDSPAGSGEVDMFTNSVTTNITSFFREVHHFEHLVNSLGGRSPDKPMTIWSAGCSSGQEPYSIAMSVLERDSRFQRNLRILATDIDTSVLEKARNGSYPGKLREGIDPKYYKFFVEICGEFKMNNDVKSCISFKRLNLFEKWPFDWTFDHIFCRNVLIYFDVEHKNQVISKLLDRLKVGGYLYLGHSESLFEKIDRLNSCGQTIYQKTT